MKNIIKKLAMLLCIATIATGAISCESKAKKEAEEAEKQAEQIKQTEIAERQQEARANEEWRQNCIEQSYKEGYDWGYSCAQGFHEENDYSLSMKEKRLDYGVTGFNKKLRDSDFGKEFPSDIPLCIEKYKKGYDDGYEEAWSFSHSY